MRPKDEAKRIAIYQAAMKVITQQGLASSSMSKIAKEAQVSPSTIYVYFENKEDMLNKLYIMSKVESCAYIFKDFHHVESVKEGLFLYIQRLYQFMLDHPVILSFHEQFVNSPNISEEARKKGEEYYTPLLELFYRGLEEKLIRHEDPEVMVAFIITPVMTLAKAQLSGMLQADPELVERVAEMSWRAISI